VVGAQPEFEDCRRRAATSGASVREVMSAAAAASRALLPAATPARAKSGRERRAGRKASKRS
jgi:hypothetical protein